MGDDGVRVCSGLFGVVRGVPEGLTMATLVNLCQVLATVGKAGIAGGSLSLWGEGHGSALLFWYERSRSWGKWGVCGGLRAAAGV